jgi:hypothetical protein
MGAVELMVLFSLLDLMPSGWLRLYIAGTGDELLGMKRICS